MLTAKYVRDNIEEVRKSLERRHSGFAIDELLELDEKTRKISKELQELRAERNKGSKEVSELKKSGKERDNERIGRLAEIKKKIDSLESDLPRYEERLNHLVWNVPNTIHESVPSGKDSTENPEIRKFGKIAKEKLEKTHEDILLGLDMIDIERAAKVSGSRFFYLKNDLVLLEQSLLRFSLDVIAKNGFTPISPPFLLRKEYYSGAVPLATFEDALYRATDPEEASGKEALERTKEELFLISTTEHPMITMHANEVLNVEELPLKYVGISPAFRREAGSHGKDTKGIFRVHQFIQTEQVIFCKQEESWKHFNEMIGNVEEIWKKLEIPYRIIEICSGDLSTRDAKSYDAEAWIPSQREYKEVASCSNCTDWQSRRLDIRYDEKGERKYVHTLNCTGIPTPRGLIPIIENNLNDDGTVTVPKVLVPYMGKEKIGKKR
jgi:seryl-tRNA synthetase